MRFSETQAQTSRNSLYLDGIGKVVSYGITGGMMAAAASPALVRGMAAGPGGRVVQRMGFEAGLQIGMSLLFNGDLKSIDVAGIGLAGLVGISAFFSQAIVDSNSKDGFSSLIGLGNHKRISETVPDVGVAGFNYGYKRLPDNSEIDKTLVSIGSTIQNPARVFPVEFSTNE